MEVKENFVTGEMFADYIDWRAEHPSDDIMTELLNAEGRRRREPGGTPLVPNCSPTSKWSRVPATRRRRASSAGPARCSRTTRIAGGLVADPSLIPAAIGEILRFESPAPHTGRYVVQDAVDVHGLRVPAGSIMLFLLGSANRDDRRYPNGDEYDIHRAPDRHLTFGNGIHLCLGSALARLKGRVRVGRGTEAVPHLGRRPGERPAVPDLDGPRLGDPSGFAHVARGRGRRHQMALQPRSSRPLRRQGRRTRAPPDGIPEGATVGVAAHVLRREREGLAVSVEGVAREIPSRARASARAPQGLECRYVVPRGRLRRPLGKDRGPRATRRTGQPSTDPRSYPRSHRIHATAAGAIIPRRPVRKADGTSVPARELLAPSCISGVSVIGHSSSDRPRPPTWTGAA